MRLFLPSDYQPKYAYPLVVVFHPNGGDEDTALRLAPQLSRRNYIAACPRGSVALGPGATGRPGFAWGDNPRADEYLFDAVAHARREYHVHSERVYLLGVGEGAAVAYRLGLAMACPRSLAACAAHPVRAPLTTVAGVIALNGRVPKPPFHRAARGLRVFVGHGANNPVVPVSAGRKAARLLDSAGADVRFQTYPTTHRVHSDMLRDVNRWIMDEVNADPDSLSPPITG
jgi:phospholipase/carboxylesterase